MFHLEWNYLKCCKNASLIYITLQHTHDKVYAILWKLQAASYSSYALPPFPHRGETEGIYSLLFRVPKNSRSFWEERRHKSPNDASIILSDLVAEREGFPALRDRETIL